MNITPMSAIEKEAKLSFRVAKGIRGVVGRGQREH